MNAPHTPDDAGDDSRSPDRPQRPAPPDLRANERDDAVVDGPSTPAPADALPHDRFSDATRADPAASLLTGGLPTIEEQTDASPPWFETIAAPAWVGGEAPAGQHTLASMRAAADDLPRHDKLRDEGPVDVASIMNEPAPDASSSDGADAEVLRRLMGELQADQAQTDVDASSGSTIQYLGAPAANRWSGPSAAPGRGRKPRRVNGKSARTPEAAARRGLILGCSGFLLVSWILAWEMTGGAAAGRWMVITMLLGFMLLWPVYRLSLDYATPSLPDATTSTPGRGGPMHPTPLRAVLGDWLCLIGLSQVALWALHVRFERTAEQTLWIDGALVGWSLLAALLIAAGLSARWRHARLAAMVGCLLLLLGEPTLMAAIGAAAEFLQLQAPAAWSMRVSPISAFWSLTETGRDWRPGEAAQTVAWVLIAVAVGWVGWLTLRLASAGAAAKFEPRPDGETAPSTPLSSLD